MNKYKTFWDYVAGSGGLYQMGPSKYRLYILDRLQELGVTSLLDEGCGTAPMYQLIKEGERPFKYKGTDFSTEMIRVAKKAFPEADLEIQDSRKMAEPNESWDCVTLIDCLDHLDNYQEAISEAVRISKKYILISLWRPLVSVGTNLNNKNMMNKNPDEQPWEDTHLQEYSQNVLLDEFRKHNLTIVEVNKSNDVDDQKRGRSLWILQK